MKYNLFKILGLILIIQFIGCTGFLNRETNRNNELKRDSYSDSLWFEYSTAIEKKDIKYLEENSFDTIQCIDCIFENKSEREYYNSRMIFNEYLDKLMHLDSLTNKEFSTFRNDSLIRISYNIKWKLAQERVYGLIFTFKKRHEKFLFDGMITTP